MLGSSILVVWALAGQAVSPVAAPIDEAADKASVAKLTAAERIAIFKAAGATAIGAGQWRMCADDAADGPASIDSAVDRNGDGRPEAVVSEGGSSCYGATGAGYALLSKQADGRWTLLDQQTGVPTFLKSRGVDGYPDIEVGGPGFCFPDVRWNGRAYTVIGNSYDGKVCRP